MVGMLPPLFVPPLVPFALLKNYDELSAVRPSAEHMEIKATTINTIPIRARNPPCCHFIFFKEINNRFGLEEGMAWLVWA